jgi:acetylglutamate kinase
MKKRMLMKIGGKAFENKKSFADLAAAIKTQGETEFIIVHGGGAEISQALQQANVKTTFVDGLRITTAEDIAIVEKVLSGTINERIAAVLTENGIPCRRMSGKTKNLFIVEPLRHDNHDMGFVGKIIRVNPKVVLQALTTGFLPVISPISADVSGRTYNVNADSAAAALAIHAQCSDLVYFTDVPGVRIGDTICHSLTVQQAQAAIDSGEIRDGMVAKMRSVFEVLQSQVQRVHIAQWAGQDTLKELTMENPKSGTMIRR